MGMLNKVIVEFYEEQIRQLKSKRVQINYLLNHYKKELRENERVSKK